MPYMGILKTKYVINKPKSLSKKLKRIYEVFFAIIVVVVLGVVVLFVVGALVVWFFKEFFGLVI